MFLTMFEKNWNIVLTMHISDVFQTIKKERTILHIFFQMWNRGLTFKTQIVYLEYVKAIQGYIFGWITKLLSLL